MSTFELIKSKQKKDIIFDLDGTICDILISWTNWEKGLAEIFSKYGEHLVPDIDYGNINQNMFVKKYGETLLHDVVNYVAQYESENITGFAPIPATIALIDKLQDLKLHVWSANSEKTIERALTELGIRNRFVMLIGRESVKYQKPETDGFNIIHELNPQAPLENYIFIGNAPNDYEAAVNAGIEYINVNEIIIED